MNNVRNIKKEDFFKKTTDAEKINFLLNYAILAPSFYNSQPWLFKISDNKCTLYLNREINMSGADPDSRNLYISLGCALENLITAAKYFGVFKKAEPILENGKYLAAEVSFVFNGQAIRTEDNSPGPIQVGPILDKEYEKLTDFIPLRYNARGIFKKEVIPPDILSRLSMFSLLDDFTGSRVDFVTNKEQIKSLGKLVSDGIKLSFGNVAFRNEMNKWIHGRFNDKKDGLPGYALNISSILSFFISRGSLLAKSDLNSFKSAPVVCVLGVNEDKPFGFTEGQDGKSKTKQEIWINMGRLTERLLLEFTARGFDTSIFSSAVQAGKLYKEVQKIVGMTERPVLIFCAGHVSGSHKYTPRFEIKDKLKMDK